MTRMWPGNFSTSLFFGLRALFEAGWFLFRAPLWASVIGPSKPLEYPLHVSTGSNVQSPHCVDGTWYRSFHRVDICCTGGRSWSSSSLRRKIVSGCRSTYLPNMLGMPCSGFWLNWLDLGKESFQLLPYILLAGLCCSTAQEQFDRLSFDEIDLR